MLTPGIKKPPLPKKCFDYDVIAQLGEGARSVLYSVTDPKTKQKFALKVVKRESEKDDRFIEQVINEHDVGMKVTHENLRKPIKLKTSRNLLLKISSVGLLMELFEGEPLESPDPKPRTLKQLIGIFLETSRGIEAMHKAGFVHCDLKPINILVNEQNVVKVIDFGQAAPINTEKSRIQGTPDYIAPEQIKLRPVTVRTDLYNLGATMYWALTGEKLPTLYTIRKSIRNSVNFVIDDVIKPPIDLKPEIPQALSDLVMECVKSDPRKRPADMAEVIARLEGVMKSLN